MAHTGAGTACIHRNLVILFDGIRYGGLKRNGDNRAHKIRSLGIQVQGSNAAIGILASVEIDVL